MSDPIPFSFRCEAKWSDMLGSGGRRLCTQCDKTVVDLSSLTKAKAEEVLATPGVCVNYQVVDGAVKYASEPVVAGPVAQSIREGARKRGSRRRLVRWAGAAASVMASTTAFAGAAPAEDGAWDRLVHWVSGLFADERCAGVPAADERLGQPVVMPEPTRLGGAPMPRPTPQAVTQVFVDSTVAAVAVELQCETGLRERALVHGGSATFFADVDAAGCVATFDGVSQSNKPHIEWGQDYDCSMRGTSVVCTARF